MRAHYRARAPNEIRPIFLSAALFLLNRLLGKTVMPVGAVQHLRGSDRGVAHVKPMRDE